MAPRRRRFKLACNIAYTANVPFNERTPPALAVAIAAALLGACASPRGAAPAGAPVQEPPKGLPAHGGPLAPVTPPAPPVRIVASATLGAVGDVLMHEAVKRSAQSHGKGLPDGGYGWLFAPVADLLSEPDLTFANLETPVAPGARTGTRAFVFDAPPEAAAALRRAGVRIVSVANNHAFDQGRAGFEETLLRVKDAGLTPLGAGPVGAAAGPLRIAAGGLSLAFLAWAQFFNQDGNACPPAKPGAPPCLQASQLDRERAIDLVRRASAEADAVVVSLHWGVEYEAQPRAEDVDLAHRLADAGALVILGHHPHVLQPIELYRRADGRTAVIAYSLGNFVSNQSRNYVHGVTPERVAATRDGAFLRVSLAKRDYGRGVVQVEVASADFVPLWTENDTAELPSGKEPGRRAAIRVVALDRALADLRAELAKFPDPVPAAERERWAGLRSREALLVSRRSAIAAVLGEDLLGATPPPPPAMHPEEGAATPTAAP